MLIALFAVTLICVFLPKCHSLRELQRKKAVLQKENRETEAQIRELKLKQERFSSDPSFVERTARETGMVKPDESVVKFTNE